MMCLLSLIILYIATYSCSKYEKFDKKDLSIIGGVFLLNFIWVCCAGKDSMAVLPRFASSPELREEPGDERPVAADIIAVRRNGIVQHCAGRIVEIVMFAVP